MILTGYADLEYAMQAVNRCRAFRVLTKPISMGDLASAVDSGLEGHRDRMARAEVQALTRIKRSMEGIIAAFVALVESRDPYTAGHQRNVAAISSALAEEMGLEKDRVTGIRMSALVHDIGKITVPAEYLNKPGRLTELEFAIIKTHPAVGYQALRGVDFYWPISRVVLEHHERLDGSGYPQGLRGYDICLEARIVAVADTVDAMLSHRPYRPGLGPERALEEICQGRGRLYDPEVAEACSRICPQVLTTLGLIGDAGPSKDRQR
ncbi:MAG: HD-GYP domain-containing protein [Deltaproteobacteria bacterium]|nr:HD-GYP domain-containing protein [Deltaproteobacteria bacterium]